MAGTNIQTVSVSFEAQVAKFQSDMRQISGATAEGVNQMTRSLGGLESSFTKAFALIGGGTAITAGIQGAIKLADEYNGLQARIKGVTAATGDYGRVSQELLTISQKNGVAMRDTVSVFQQLQRSAKELGASNADMIKLTDVVQKLGVIGGSSSEQMKNGMLQFSQALAGGTVHAEEFNSILENMPEVANRIAKGMGIPMGQLRQMVKDQKIAAADLYDALMKQKNTVESEFNKMPASVERSWLKLTSSVQQSIGELDKSFGMTKSWATGFDTLATAISRAGSEFAQWNANTLTGGNGKSVSISDFIGTEAKTLALSAANGYNLIRGNYDGPGGTKNDRFGGKAAHERWATNQARYDAERRQVYGLETGTFVDRRDGNMGPPSRADYYGPAGMRQELLDAQTTKSATRGPAAIDKKLVEKQESERKHIESTIEGYRVQNRELDLKLAKQDEGKAKLEHEIKLIKESHLSQKEQVAAIQQMSKIYDEIAKKEAFIETQKKQKAQEGKVDDLLKDVDKRRQEIKAEVDGRKGLQQVLGEEIRLKELLEQGNLGSAKVAEKYVKAAADIEALKQETAAKEAAKQTEKSADETAKYTDRLGDLTKAQDEAADAAMRKARGEDNVSASVTARREIEDATNATLKKQTEIVDNLNKLLEASPNNAGVLAEKLKAEEALNNIYTAREKALKGVADSEAKISAANEEMKVQKEVLEQVKRSAVSLTERIKFLDQAYREGKVTTKQYTDALQDLQDEGFKKTKASADAFAKTITSGLERALTSGKSFKETIKDIGKELALLAARKLLFQPLEQGISNIAQRFFGQQNGIQPGYTPGINVPGQVAGSGMAVSASGANSLPWTIADPFNVQRVGAGANAGGAASGGFFGGLMGGLGALLKFLPGFADGGMYSPGMGPVRVGERGPEWFFPQQSGYIQPFMPYMGSAGGRGGVPQYDPNYRNAPGTYGTGAGTFGQPNYGNTNGWTYQQHAEVMAKTFRDLEQKAADDYRNGRIQNPSEIYSNRYWSGFYGGEAMTGRPISRLSVDPVSIDWAQYNSMGGAQYVSPTARANDAALFGAGRQNAMWGGFQATPIGSSFGDGAGGGGDIGPVTTSSWSRGSSFVGGGYQPTLPTSNLQGSMSSLYGQGLGGMMGGGAGGFSAGQMIREYGSAPSTSGSFSSSGQLASGGIGGARINGVDPYPQNIMDILTGRAQQDVFNGGWQLPGQGIDPRYVPEGNGSVHSGARTQPQGTPGIFGPTDADRYINAMGMNASDFANIINLHLKTAGASGGSFERLVDQLNSGYKSMASAANRGFPESEGRQRMDYQPMTPQDYRNALSNYYVPMIQASSNEYLRSMFGIPGAGASIIQNQESNTFGGYSRMPRMRRGGRVDKGEAVITGDAGLEVFVPHENGSIVPNSALGVNSGGAITVNLINNTPVSMAPPEVSQNGSEIQIILKAVAQNIRQGGEIGSAVQGTFGTKFSNTKR